MIRKLKWNFEILVMISDSFRFLVMENWKSLLYQHHLNSNLSLLLGHRYRERKAMDGYMAGIYPVCTATDRETSYSIKLKSVIFKLMVKLYFLKSQQVCHMSSPGKP
jgi:hypothetical protein